MKLSLTPEQHRQLEKLRPKLRGEGLGSSPCSAIPAAQVLVYQPELTHSVWTDVMHRKRSRKSLEAMLRKGVRSGEYVGYRLLTIEAEYVGISWPNAELTRPEAQ